MPHPLESLQALVSLRQEAVNEHREWKRRSFTLDTILDSRWATVWDDLTAELSEPLVENIPLQALEDRAAQAASVEPRLIVAPTRGTRKDAGEKNAATRRHAILSMWQRSRWVPTRKLWYIDRIAHAAAYGVPWADFYRSDYSRIPPGQRLPYMKRIDPRQVYPLSHNSAGRMTGVILTRTRRWADIVREWGDDNLGLRELKARVDMKRADPRAPFQIVEETWYFDDTYYAVGLTARPQVSPTFLEMNYLTRYSLAAQDQLDVWLQGPVAHGLRWCPVVEAKRVSWDGGYRSELDGILPQMKVAQNLMARYLEDIGDAVSSPVVMRGIQNPEDYGPYAELLDDGSGTAQVEYPRKPSTFEVRQAVVDQIEMGRRQGRQPAQRAGEGQGGWNTGRGVDALLDGYSTVIADAQSDIATFLTDLSGMLANYDEVHCSDPEGGQKEIEGTDGQTSFSATYNPASLWKGDHRCIVTYGAATGLDQAQLFSRLSLAKSQGLMTTRTFMMESGIVSDPLQEEREIMLENVSQAMVGFLFSQAQAGNLAPLQELYKKLDGDTASVRQAVLELLSESQAVPSQGPGNPTGPQGDQLSALLGDVGQTGPPALATAGQSLRSVLPNGISQNLPRGA